MKIGQSIKYTTKGGETHKITKDSENQYSFGFDCERTLSKAKESLEWLDNPNRTM